MIGILVDHDWIRVPNPIGDVRNVLWKNAKVGALEPESTWTTTFQAEDMTGSEAQRKAPVLEGTINVVACIVATLVVANPLTVGVYMRGVGMSFSVTEIALLRRRLLRSPLFWSALFWSALFWSALFWSALRGSLPLFRGPLLRGLPGRRRRTVGWDISAADPAVFAAPAPIPILRNARDCKAHREQRQKYYIFLHSCLHHLRRSPEANHLSIKQM